MEPTTLPTLESVINCKENTIKAYELYNGDSSRHKELAAAQSNCLKTFVDAAPLTENIKSGPELSSALKASAGRLKMELTLIEKVMSETVTPEDAQNLLSLTYARTFALKQEVAAWDKYRAAVNNEKNISNSTGLSSIIIPLVIFFAVIIGFRQFRLNISRKNEAIKK